MKTKTLNDFKNFYNDTNNDGEKLDFRLQKKWITPNEYFYFMDVIKSASIFFTGDFNIFVIEKKLEDCHHNSGSTLRDELFTFEFNHQNERV